MENELFKKQLARLDEAHFLLLYWTTVAEDKEQRYNITNAFDDLKFHKVTRTKQSAVAFVDSLHALCLIDVREESNRKNLYLSEYGGLALQELITDSKFSIKNSIHLEG